MAMKLEDQLAEANEREKAALAEMRELQSPEFTITEKAHEDAKKATYAHKRLVESAVRAHRAKVLGLPKSAKWDDANEAAARFAARWAGLTEEELDAGVDQHNGDSLANKCAHRVLKLIDEVIPNSGVASLHKETEQFDERESAAYSAHQPHKDLLRQAERRMYNARSAASEAHRKIVDRDDRRDAPEAKKKKPRANKAHVAARTKLRELAGYATDHWRARSKHTEAMKAFIKKELP